MKFKGILNICNYNIKYYVKMKKKELQEMKKNGRSTLSESKVNFV